MSQRMIVHNIKNEGGLSEFLEYTIRQNSDQRMEAPSLQIEISLDYNYNYNENNSHTNLTTSIISYYNALGKVYYAPLAKCNELVKEMVDNQEYNEKLLICMKNLESNPETIKFPIYKLTVEEGTGDLFPVELTSDNGSSIDGEMLIKLSSYNYDELNHKATIDFDRIAIPHEIMPPFSDELYKEDSDDIIAQPHEILPPLPVGEIYKVYSDETHDRVFVEMFEII